MTIHLHHLHGCAPTPLAHYLKAIGILRIVAQQKDPEVPGFWRDLHFCLLTTLDEPALERFFLEEYAPTPVFNPWGARSGFFGGSSETTARKRLSQIEKSTTARLAPFRQNITEARAAVRRLGGSKPEEEETKTILLRDLRVAIRGAGEDWLNSVTAIVGESLKNPAIFGTGGNEGSGGYPSAYYEAVIDCVLSRERRAVANRLAQALRGVEAQHPDDLWTETFGQFIPDGRGNAWDLLLGFEGAVSFRSGVTRRASVGRAERFLSSPFFLPHEAVGAGSDAAIDEYAVNKGKLNPGRGEQWFPCWESPATFAEISATIAEGRCSVGKQTAHGPLDAALAIGRHGVARGISSFVRYGYLQRNNQATHFAVPLGVISVEGHAQSRLLDELRPWLARIHREARAKGAPFRAILAERTLSEAAFAAAQREMPTSWQDLLIACADVEMIQASGTAFEIGPCPKLPPSWLDAAADDSPEWRLACALGSAAGGYKEGRAFDPVRAHALPIDPKKSWSYAIGADKRLVNDPRVVMMGRDPLADLIALVERRLIEASQRGSRTLPLVAGYGAGARLDDLARFLDGEVDVERVVSMARALMALDWGRARLPRPRIERRGGRPDEGWEALRLCALPFAIHERTIATEPALFRRLASGDATGAVELALRRLRASGFRPPLVAALADPSTARRWAAAFAFPIDPRAAGVMADRFENPTLTENP